MTFYASERRMRAELLDMGLDKISTRRMLISARRGSTVDLSCGQSLRFVDGLFAIDGEYVPPSIGARDDL